MANYCWYQIRVKGKKKNAFMIYHTMPVYDENDIIHQEGTEENYSLIFSGSCKWSLEAYCDNSITNLDINVDDFIGENGELLKNVTDYWYYSLKDKSKLYNCEIEAFAEYEDYDINGDYGDRPTFEHYKNGEVIENQTQLSFADAQKRVEELFKIKNVIPNYYTYEDYDDYENDYDENIFPFTTELTNTQLNGGVERAEHYKVGDEVTLVPEPDNQYDEEAIRVDHELGFVGYLASYNYDIIEKLKETNNTNPKAKIVNVEPLSKRGPRCKKPIVEIEVYLTED